MVLRFDEDPLGLCAGGEDNLRGPHLRFGFVLIAVGVVVRPHVFVRHRGLWDARADVHLQGSGKTEGDGSADFGVLVEPASVRFGGQEFCVDPGLKQRPPGLGRVEARTEVRVLEVHPSGEITKGETFVADPCNDRGSLHGRESRAGIHHPAVSCTRIRDGDVPCPPGVVATRRRVPTPERHHSENSQCVDQPCHRVGRTYHATDHRGNAGMRGFTVTPARTCTKRAVTVRTRACQGSTVGYSHAVRL